ncbi:MAG: hypothetical protein JOZ86_10680 [Candidatus Eremiobacteraeota bacterium]|nr:hypothetical protein [Candidatus Eremiobacteraeota bacterium]
MAYLFPAGVSALIDPDDEPHLAFLELCAEVRRRLGQPSYTRADLERLFALKDVAAPAPPRSDKVVPLAAYARRRRRPMQY